ncbi:MAG: GDP-L-fucose synthase [Candidatus Burarchaeum sp.]|nr:GDP-L-fucose synthase [Candidatus Burarchaeum sp.]MDO8339037.1 GDP-L-fucose synthase [Candidatus Burarchaeum sp.]
MELRGKRILLTGGHGFLGAPLSKLLEAEKPSELIRPHSSEYDLCEQADVRKLFKDSQPEIVIHAAGKVGGIGETRQHPGDFYYQNLMMGALTIDEARKAGVKKLVAIGSVCAYPREIPLPFKEENLWAGYPEETNAPYGLAKKMMLVQLQAYRQQYGFNGIYLIPVNLYGPGDHFNDSSSHVISAMIYKCVKANAEGAESVTFWGDGKPTREFLYVDDCARAIVLAAKKYDGSEPVNVGSGQEISILQLAKLVVEKTGFRGEVVWDKSKPGGQPRRLFDSSRAKKYFGFEASMPFDKGIALTIADYVKNKKTKNTA